MAGSDALPMSGLLSGLTSGSGSLLLSFCCASDSRILSTSPRMPKSRTIKFSSRRRPVIAKIASTAPGRPAASRPWSAIASCFDPEPSVM